MWYDNTNFDAARAAAGKGGQRVKQRLKTIALCVMVLAVVVFAVFAVTYRLDMLPDVSHPVQPAQTTVPRTTYVEKQTRDYLPTDAVVRPVGRTLYYDNVRWFSLSGCGAEFSCVADWAQLTLTVAQSYAVVRNHRPRVAVFVNGTLADERVLDSAEETIEIDLSDIEGEAVVKLIKLTESMYSCVGLTGIRVYAAADVTPTPQPDMLLEFIGDSITAGYGLDATSAYGQFSTRTENYMGTYAYLTGEALGAESYAVAYSGYGVLSAYTDNGVIRPDYVLSKRYNKTLTNLILPAEVSDEWTFTSLRPTMIVINLGTNDASYCYTAERRAAFVTAYRNLLVQVRMCNPGVPIICVLGDMNNSLYPYITQAAAEYQAETGDPLVTCTSLSFEMERLGSTTDGHPNRDSNALAAQTLTTFLWQTALSLQ